MSDSANNTAVKKTADKTGNSATPSFWTGIKAELKKIVWPDKPTLMKQTSAVVVVSVVIGAIIAVLDRVVLYAVNLILK
ncbi:MAG: preprotein translocase subunit SecE [Lachnospiraceae bacterium]|nr:preprotein translocase subunit SecE [Lachnospiraceae bacterium]